MNTRTRDGFYALWTAAILICLVACIVVLAYVSIADAPATAEGQLPVDGSQLQTDQPAEDGQQPAEQQQDAAVPPVVDPSAVTAPPADQPAAVTAPPAPSTVTLPETADMGTDYLDRIVFLGDSTTYGMYAYNVLPHDQIWVPSSGTLSLFNWAVESVEYYPYGDNDDHQTLSIADAAATAKPEYLVITLGINGVSLLDEEQFRGYYTGLVQAIQAASPDTKIIFQSIYPVIDAQTPEGIKNDRINAANGWILDMAGQLGARYLATHDALTDSTGNLSLDYITTGSDGIHMDQRGYNAILQYVRTHAWQ